MRHHLHRLALVAVAVAAVACGSKSPSSPSGGVTINGSIVAPAGTQNGSHASTATASSLSVASVVPAGLRVSVAGSNISVAIDAAGQFSLKNVPPGNPQLRFTAPPGLDVLLSLTDVQDGQTVTIAVSLDGSTATLESDRRSVGSEEQLEGRVESLPPTTTAGTLVVAGRTVTTSDTTTYWLQGQPSSFAMLALGQRVHVKGQSNAGALAAREIKIQNTNTGNGLNLNGTISGFSGTRDAFEFTVNGQLIKGDTQTEFFGNSQFLELTDGARVEVKGSQRDGFVYATRIHVNVEGIDLEGALAARAGTAPDLTFTLAGKTVKMSADTEVRRKGDTQDVSVLYNGQIVELTGTLLADGTVIARKVNIVTDAPGGYFEMEGTIGGKTGTCPTLSFSVSGYAITTTLVDTTFDPTGSCASLSNGTKVLVKGTVQADLSVLATLVKK